MPQLVRTLLKPISGLFGKRTADEACAPESPLSQSADLRLEPTENRGGDELQFSVNRPLLPEGDSLHFATVEAAARSPLAQALLGVPGVASITLERSTVAILLQPGQDNTAANEALQQALTRFHASGQPAVKKARYNFGFQQVPSRSREEQFSIVERLFADEVNPSVAAHGGRFSLVDVRDNSVYVRLEGGCQGCGMANVTLKQGVEARLREVLPELSALVDVTDHASGENPYYAQSKK